ncbi:MAG: hypothetical protein AVDCRST_MAG61-2241, partial [uncultured Friedmanniella sp.]
GRAAGAGGRQRPAASAADLSRGGRHRRHPTRGLSPPGCLRPDRDRLRPVRGRGADAARLGHARGRRAAGPGLGPADPTRHGRP